ncbi:MAG: L-aspartate oxidase [Candidatus Subteraquimicrobiales bacterium]|nr:L-aspartate oxidase [Candidatus Subteraquimicrobiales bacterium]
MFPRYLINFDLNTIEKFVSDILVIGSGIAGLNAILKSSDSYQVTLLTKSELKEATSWYAQGGVATAIGEEDSPRLHFEDTMVAGAYLNDPRAVEILVYDGIKAINELILKGVDFDKAVEGGVRLAREGGHSISRILHSGDATGSEIQSNLVKWVKDCPNVQIRENEFVVDLLTFNGRSIGVLAYGYKDKKLRTYLARAVIVATGGMGQLYLHTTNPSICTGDGIAMAYRAGAEVMDMEFIQFHPTALDGRENPRFLITEALRGEGAYLSDCEGKRFMVGAHPKKELAPRDIVVREMIKAMKRCKSEHVYLDATHIPADELKKRFSNIWQKCLECGFDLSKDLIPVSPVAHYIMGGIKADINGKTNIPGFYVSGEVACSGVHGANRLASNSLLEGLVFSERIVNSLPEDMKDIDKENLGKISSAYSVKRKKLKVNIEEKKNNLRLAMTENVGVIRSKEGLEKILELINSMKEILEAEFISPEGFELQNMITVAELIARSALMREESRGAHFRSDFPSTDDLHWKKHIVLKHQ